MAAIRVVVNGATGKMGMESVSAIGREPDLDLVGATCRQERGATLQLPNGVEVPLSTNLEHILTQTHPAVLIDFTNAAACMKAAPVASAYSINMVLGASGLTEAYLK